MIADVHYLAQTVDYSTFHEYNCQRAALFFKNHLELVWSEYKSSVLSKGVTADFIKENFPFKAYIMYRKQETNSDQLVDIFSSSKSQNKKDLLACVNGYWNEIVSLFDQVTKLSPLEIIREDS